MAATLQGFGFPAHFAALNQDLTEGAAAGPVGYDGAGKAGRRQDLAGALPARAVGGLSVATGGCAGSSISFLGN